MTIFDLFDFVNCDKTKEVPVMNETKKLSGKTIFGYAFGSMADAASYNFIIMYMLYFLTAIIGLSAGKAGIIISVSTVVSAIYGLIIGPLSDNTRSRFGRRRPFLLIGAVLLFIGLILLFRPFELSQSGAFAFYLVVLLIVWLGYNSFLVPYNALGSELTANYDERTKLRTPAGVFNCIGNIIGISLPLTAVAFFAKRGADEGTAWSYFAIILAAACAISILITWKVTKGKELPMEVLMQEEKENNPIKTYWQILKLKPFRWIIGFVAMFAVGYIVFQSGLIYYILFYAGMSEAQMSQAMFINIFVAMATTLVISVLAVRINKKKAFAICFLISAAGMIVLYFVGVKSFAMLIVLLAVFGIGNSAYWLLIFPLIYDLSEVYEYKYGKRKEGSLLSMLAFIFTLATSLGTQVLTITMTMVGYDPSLPMQSEGTVNGIANIVFGIPVAMFILGALCCMAYPMSKKAYEKLVIQLDRKKAGESVDETGLERLV